MPSSHAILAPSAAKRWMSCAPSARLEEKIPATDTSYTREGTIAHAVAELLLNRYLKAKRTEVNGDLPLIWKTHQLDAGAQLLVEEAEKEGLDFWEILQTVHDKYVAIVYEDYLNALAKDPSALLLVEAELKLDEFIPEGFGSADAVIIYDNVLHVYDLKYGKGVKVSANHNPQMMCYALGALYGPGEVYNIDEVRMTIIQPRLEHVSTFSMTYTDIIRWGFGELKPKAEAAFAGWGSFAPGEHCKFCRAAAQCQALKTLAQAECCQQPELMTPKELGEALEKVDVIKAYVAALEEYTLSKALDGMRIPGWKVVEGRSIRKISEPDKAVATLVELGWDAEQCYKPRELRTITDLEKMVGKKQFNSILGPYVVKPQGKPTLAPESDPREELNSAEKDFETTL